jgi:hypothetical protein
MDNVRRLGDSISIPIRPDEEGFIGRECPQQDCQGYFKIEFGTGLKGENLPCHCPYCGYTSGQEQFWTKEQIEYAKSVAVRQITKAVHGDLKKMEFDYKPKGGFGLGISLKLEPLRPVPIRYYREKQLETEVICSNCMLRYAVYGVFAFCPDCGQHNSVQILDKNLEVIGKMLDLAAGMDIELAQRLVENALEDCVSAFDGYGRELCKLYKESATDPAKAEKIRFQNLDGARSAIAGIFRIDLSANLTADEWQLAVRNFQKRHLIAHKMGVVDEDYITKTGDARAISGRKVNLETDEVRELVHILGKLARGFSGDLKKARKKP